MSCASFLRRCFSTRSYLPRVALIGRPNVGKSSLWRRLTGLKTAIVSEVPGTTRDRLEAPGSLLDLRFTVVDTPGLEDDSEIKNDVGDLKSSMMRQSQIAVAQCDVAIFVVDVREGITPLDQHFANWLRTQINKDQERKSRSDLKIIVAVNKCEQQDPIFYDFYRLGFGDPVPISALQGHGKIDLFHKLDQVFTQIQEHHKSDSQPDDPVHSLDRSVSKIDLTKSILQLAITARANAGKSTFVNAVLQEDRVLTGPTPGVTRDSVAVDLWYNSRRKQITSEKDDASQHFRLIDTAGLRGTTSMSQSYASALDSQGMAQSMRSIRFANVVAVFLDVSRVVPDTQEMGVYNQDQSQNMENLFLNSLDMEQLLSKVEVSIASHVLSAGRCLCLVANKIDLIPEKFRSSFVQRIRNHLDESLGSLSAGGIPVLGISALQGTNLPRVLEQAIDLHKSWNTRVTTGMLNKWLDDTKAAYGVNAPRVHGRPVNIKYVTQIKSRPPTFAFFTSTNAAKATSYLQYFVNSLRDTFSFHGVPIRVLIRSAKNPFAPKKEMSKSKTKKRRTRQKKSEKLERARSK